jgi:hypothetical protein
MLPEGVKARGARTDKFGVKRGLVLLVVGAALVFAGTASALIEPGNIGALPANPYPTQPGQVVNGTLFTNQPPGPGGTPQDYLKFTVTSPGETIVFTDQNTTTGVNPYMCSHYCPVYLSLVNSSFTGLGDGSGTIATYGDTENVPWTFATPGTYYIVMESDGDVNLSYAASYAVVSGGSGGGGGGNCQQDCGPAAVTSPPLVRALHVSPKQRGTSVNAFVKPGQALQSARVLLLYGKHTIAAQTRGPLGTARYRFTLHLPAAYRHRLKAHHKLHVVVRITASGATGATVTYNRAVTLT